MSFLRNDPVLQGLCRLGYVIVLFFLRVPLTRSHLGTNKSSGCIHSASHFSPHYISQPLRPINFLITYKIRVARGINYVILSAETVE